MSSPRPAPPLVLRLLVGALVAAAASVPFLLLMALVVRGGTPLHDVDAGARDSLHDVVVGSPGLVSFLDDVAVVFAPTTFRLAVAVACVWLWLRGARATAVWAAVAMAVGGAGGVVFKETVRRTRPALADPVAHAGGFSFPSGHAVNSFLGCTLLLIVLRPVLSRAAWRAALLVASAIVLLTGVDRVALGVHYVSDVLGGWAFAGAVVVGTSLGFSSWWHRFVRRGEGPVEAVEAATEEAVDGTPGPGAGRASPGQRSGSSASVQG